MTSPKNPLPTVSEFMDRQTHAVHEDEDVFETVLSLIKFGITGAPVVDRQGAPVGLITEAECLLLMTGGRDQQLPKGPVRDYMRAFTTVEPHWDIYYVAGMFRAKPVERRFLVVSSGSLIGVITRKDILRELGRRLAER